MKQLNLRLLSVMVSVLLLTAVTTRAAGPAKQWGQLQVVDGQLCSQQGEPVTLRGVSLGWHNLWPRFYNAGAVRWLANDWHCSVIRAAMGLHIEDNYLENPEHAMRCITSVVDAAIKNDIYVIIDWHSHRLLTPEATKFFGEMARRYGKHPNVIYELFNEPVEDSWESLKQYATAVIAEIRKYDPDNIILMGSPHWDQDIHIVADSPLEGVTNVMYTMHFYAATHGEELRGRAEYALSKGIPLFVSECAGMIHTGDGPIDLEQWQTWIDWLEKKHISWACWSISDKNETCSMLLPRAKSDGHWTDDVFRAWGRHVRTYLRKYNKQL